METNNTAERPHYDSWAECENCNQDRLKKWYDTKTGYRVWKRICPQCGKEFYTIDHFRKYCHLSDCRDIAKKKRMEEKKREHHSEHICSVCSASFIAKRTDAKYCSNACRQKAYREKK